jgi:uncharacterized protein (TIGR00369 family)
MAHRHPPPPTELDAPFIEGLTRMWEEQIVFNHVLGMRITAIQPQQASASIAMKRDLIGHFGHRRLHGGVISAGLDAMGGLAIMAAIGARHMDEPVERRLDRFMKMGTIDLRIDYLRPAIGESFLLRAQVLRLGSRVATTRMEFLAADGELLSVGAAAYIVS